MMKLNKLIAFSIFCFISVAAIAQKERTDDLVPFRKGNKWGIVHHDGKFFYPATLDSVVLIMKYNGSYKVFDHDKEPGYAKVIVNGKPMLLKANKKLEAYSDAMNKFFLEEETIRISLLR